MALVVAVFLAICVGGVAIFMFAAGTAPPTLRVMPARSSTVGYPPPMLPPPPSPNFGAVPGNPNGLNQPSVVVTPSGTVVLPDGTTIPMQPPPSNQPTPYEQWQQQHPASGTPAPAGSPPPATPNGTAPVDPNANGNPDPTGTPTPPAKPATPPTTDDDNAAQLGTGVPDNGTAPGN
ncbi:MAG: hypothetical protein ACREJ2_09520 [Planctomycetota bacterium]